MSAPKPKLGFTILELSVVLVIIALITGIGITSGIGMVEGAKRSATENKMDAIEKALMSFRQNYDRLPCPSDLALASTNANIGVEADYPGECVGGTVSATYSTGVASDKAFMVEGAVPVKALGLPNDFLYDGWGRRFAYSVPIEATAFQAFTAIPPDGVCGIQVTDGLGTSRTTYGAVYALVSAGPNGFGAYLPNGTRITTGDRNHDDEKTNFHTTGSFAAVYVQRDPSGDNLTTDDAFTTNSKVFDDVVRFKSRWQMEPTDKKYDFSGTKGATFVVGNEKSVLFYTNKCGLWEMTELLSPGDAFNAGVAFLPDNSIFSTSENGCKYYALDENGNYDSGTEVFDSAGNACPPSFTYKAAVSNNGYLGVVDPSTAANTIYLWKQVGGQLIPLPRVTSIFVLGPDNGGNPKGVYRPDDAHFIAFGKNAEYMALSDPATVTTIYRRKGDVFTMLPLAERPENMDTVRAIAFSPNGRYFAIAEENRIAIWIIGRDGKPFFNAATADYKEHIELIPSGYSQATNAIVFSADGGYMATVGDDSGGGSNITVYKIDPGDTFTQLSDPTGWSNSGSRTGNGVAFSPDSNYMIVVGLVDGSYPYIFRRRSNTEFELLSDSYISPSNDGYFGTNVAYRH